MTPTAWQSTTSAIRWLLRVGFAQGYKPDVDPNAFSVVDVELFLNFSPVVSKRWEQDIPGHIKTGNEKWKTLVSQ